MNNNYERCSQCGKREVRIETKAGRKCWPCYNVELKIFKKDDWRDHVITEYAEKNDLNQREGETKQNMVNRNKAFLAKHGFIFK